MYILYIIYSDHYPPLSLRVWQNSCGLRTLVSRSNDTDGPLGGAIRCYKWQIIVVCKDYCFNSLRLVGYIYIYISVYIDEYYQVSTIRCYQNFCCVSESYFFPPSGSWDDGSGDGDLWGFRACNLQYPPPKWMVSPSMGGSPVKDVALMRVNFNIWLWINTYKYHF